jgi:hypothetical protein
VIVAGGAVLVTARGSRVALRAAREHAQQARLWEKRADTYVELLVWCNRMREILNRIYPRIGPGPELPDPVPESDIFLLEAKVKAFGSDDVDALLVEMTEPYAKFNVQAMMLREDDEKTWAPQTLREVYGVSRHEAYRDLDARRQQIIATLDRIGRRIRAELTTHQHDGACDHGVIRRSIRRIRRKPV